MKTMYYKYDNVNTIIDELKSRQAFKVKAIATWSKVIIAKKKNGEEFSTLTNAIKNNELYKSHDLFINDNYGKSLKICVNSYPHYEFDDISIQKGYPAEDMTAEEVRKAIEKRITDYSEEEKDLARQIKIAEKAFNEYRQAIAEAEKRLAAIANKPGDKYPSSLYYKITETR